MDTSLYEPRIPADMCSLLSFDENYLRIKMVLVNDCINDRIKMTIIQCITVLQIFILWLTCPVLKETSNNCRNTEDLSKVN